MSDTITATAHEGETIDALIWRVLGAGTSVLQTVLDLNRDLADLGQILPTGQIVILPRLTTETVKTVKMINLWD